MKHKKKKVLGVCLLLGLAVQNISPCQRECHIQIMQADSGKNSDIAEFPESYQSALRKLKKKHPNWTFKRVNVNVSWDTIIKNESVTGVNTITSDVPNGGISGTYSAPLSYLSTAEDTYDAYEDKYKVIDSANRYTPSSQVIEYYMDPRNFLNEEQIFQFESLEYDKEQSVQGVKKILEGTFMKKNYTYKLKKKKITKNYAKTFCDAGEKYKVNPYFLAVRARQEVGNTLSDSTSGKCKGYKGYYNFYNIGASDSGNGTAVIKGLRFAKTKGDYGRPWNSQYKAILGGAEYIAEKYISIGQNTFYFQKFSVIKKKYRYWHQYMSNIEGAKSEAKKMYDMYKERGMLKEKTTFRIPVYKDMPSSAVKLPKSEGSSNNYIKHITVAAGKKRISLVTSKNYKSTSFFVTVPNRIKKVKVKGTACNKNAKITGGKIYQLTAGKIKTIKLTVTAENGAVRKCYVKIKRQERI